eukprot:scaffold7915_cov152-Skeletonema_menzelii.AAC.4
MLVYNFVQDLFIRLPQLKESTNTHDVTIHFFLGREILPGYCPRGAKKKGGSTTNGKLKARFYQFPRQNHSLRSRHQAKQKQHLQAGAFTTMVVAP